MSSPVIALSLASPAKSPKKRKPKKTGPTLSSRILKAVAASSQRGGVSLVALKKVLKAGGYDVVKNKTRIRVAIKRLLAKKSLVKAKGSFKLNKKPPKPRKRKVVKKKKPKAKKAKKATAKKGAKKSPKKKKAKRPKKAKKPAAKKPRKSPKKARSTRARAGAKK
uniref:H15 domain-containing protein n=1 Tax=Iconisemion striatum TaxID=60296 RepID=A0A1A7YL39_9TELE